MILSNANPKYSFRGISQSDIISKGGKMVGIPMPFCDGNAKIIMPFQVSITQKKISFPVVNLRRHEGSRNYSIHKCISEQVIHRRWMMNRHVLGH